MPILSYTGCKFLLVVLSNVCIYARHYTFNIKEFVINNLIM